MVIPTYNEKGNICNLIEEIHAVLPQAEVLIIDDNSPDGTGELIERMKKKLPFLHTHHRKSKLGLGTAYKTGFALAFQQGAEIVLQMDADFSHHPRYLPKFVEEIEDCDVVIGSRYIPGGETPGWKLSRRFLSRMANLYVRVLLRLKVKDATSGFRGYRREVLSRIPWERVSSSGYSFQIEMVYLCQRLGFKIKEIPIVFEDRKQGVSKLSRRIIVEALWLVLKNSLKTLR